MAAESTKAAETTTAATVSDFPKLANSVDLYFMGIEII
jgi:hypothetical protein